jgi:hypothetical protein
LSFLFLIIISGLFAKTSNHYYYYYLLLLLSSSSSSSFLVAGFLSSLVLPLLSQWWTPPLRLQVSACSTFLMMCDVPSRQFFVESVSNAVLAVLSYNSPGRNDYRYAKHFVFHVLWILYPDFCILFCVVLLPDGIAASIGKQILSSFNYYVWPVCQNLSSCLCPLIP